MTPPARDCLAEAMRLLEEVALVDGHNDLPYLMRRDAGGDPVAYGLRERRPERDTDIERLRAGRVSGQFWAAFVPPRSTRPAAYALQQIALIRRLALLFPDVFMNASASSDIERAKREGKIASFIAIENGAAIEEPCLDALDAFYDLGVRLVTLCHNLTTQWCDSATDRPKHNGLTDFGRRVVERMNRLGMLIDLSHVSDTAANQVLDQTAAPVVWSHSNARRLCDHRRNIPDETLARIAQNGGMVMATFVPDFLSQRSRDWIAPLQDEHGKSPADVDIDAQIASRESSQGRWPLGGLTDLCDHLDYLAAVVGADHVGLGSDFFGGPQGPGLEDASCFPAVFAELLRRGWSRAALIKLASGNLIRVMGAVEAAAGAR
ncbi:MAG TPA: dipeptidase [Beijerinckiaceae bacterium]|nr:dipeptidase [Beijerinckiaceae bacterium]